MFINKKLYIIICFVILTSCAGLLMSYDAKREFEQGLAFFNQGKYEDALKHFEKAVELEPEYTKAYLYLGRSFLNLGKWFEAIPPLRTAYSLSPVETKKEVVNILIDALIGGALAEFKKGNYKKSIDYFKEALDIKPDYSDAQPDLIKAIVAYGGQLLSEGNASDAISQFSEALRLAPNNLDAYLGLAKAFLKNGDFLQAITTINEALKIAPTEKERSLFKELLDR